MYQYSENVFNGAELPYKLDSTFFYSIPPHWHDEFQVGTVIEGDGDLWINGKYIHLLTGETFFINPYDMHFYNGSPKCGKIIVLTFPASIAGVCSDLLKNRIIKNNFSKEPLFFNLLTELFYEHQKKLPGYELFEKSKFYTLLSCMVRKLVWVNASKNQHRQYNLIKIKPILDYVFNNYSTCNNLKKYLNTYNLSDYKELIKYINQNTGLNFIDYLNRVRVYKSEQMLLNTNILEEEIAQFCGFKSLESYNKYFNKINNISPTEFRKKNILSPFVS